MSNFSPEGKRFSGPSPLHDFSARAAEDLYSHFAIKFETDSASVHRGPYCGYIVPDLQQALERGGFEVEKHRRDFADGSVHWYVKDSEGTIVDPTWQQFVDPKRQTPDLPKVLFGTREQIAEYLDSLGLGERLGKIWSTDDPNTANPNYDDNGAEDWGWRGHDRDYYSGLPETSTSVDDIAVILASIVRDFPIPEVVGVSGRSEAMARSFTQEAEAANFTSEELRTAVYMLSYVSEYAREAAAQVNAAGEEVSAYMSQNLAADLHVEPENPADYFGLSAQEHAQSIDTIIESLNELIENIQQKLADIVFTTEGSSDVYWHVHNAKVFTDSSVQTLEQCISVLQGVKRHMDQHYAKKAAHEAEQQRATDTA